MINAGARAAVKATRNGKIGVIGTEGTVGSGIYTEVMKQLRPVLSYGKVLSAVCTAG